MGGWGGPAPTHADPRPLGVGTHGALGHLPEKVPEKTPGAWFTKLSMTAPGLREREAGLPPGVEAGLPALAGGEQSIC